MALKYGDVQNQHQHPPAVKKENFELMLEGFLFLMFIFSCLFVLSAFSSGDFLGAFQTLRTAAIFFGLLFLKLNWDWVLNKINHKTAATTERTKEDSFAHLDHSLEVGLTTGILTERGHQAGAAGDQIIHIPFADCAQNFVCFGGTGSGKTTRFINGMLFQMMAARTLDKQGEREYFGGLIFDVKGDFCKSVYEIAKMVGGRPIYTVGVGADRLKVNLLAGLTPATATDFLRSAYALGGSRSNDSVWLDSALELTQSVLTILEQTAAGYTIKGLYEFIFDAEKRSKFMAEAQENVSCIADKTDFEHAIYYYENVYSKYDEKLIKSVEFTLSPVIKAFQTVELSDAFCNTDPVKNYDLKDILNNGDIVLVDLPLVKFGKAGKTVYTLLKLRYFNLMQSRHADETLNKDRFCFFLCDEYQELISSTGSAGLSDGNFWDKSRSSRMIGIISAQSIAAFETAIGDRTKTQTILSNFVQKICFRTGEEQTIRYFSETIGKAEVQKFTHNEGSSAQWYGGNMSNNQGYSVSYVDKHVIDANLFRQLGDVPNAPIKGTTTALACLSIEGRAIDDVIMLTPLFID